MVGCPGFADQPANAQKAQAMGVALQVRGWPCLGPSKLTLKQRLELINQH